MNLNGNSMAPDAGQTIVTNYLNGKETASVNNSRNTDGIHEVNLTDLNVGDVFSGEILDINNHEVSILLNDNNVVNALLKQSFELNIGQYVIFQVKDKSEGQIFIRPLADETVPAELINRSLKAAGLSVNDKNSLIVSSLIEHGQPIDRQTVIQYLKLSNQFGLENLNKLIDMVKQGIHINNENIEMYDKYVHSTHQISDMIKNIPDKMTGCLENMIQGDIAGNMSEIEEFITLLNEISDVIETDYMEETENQNTIKEIFIEDENPADGKITSGGEPLSEEEITMVEKNPLEEKTLSNGKIMEDESMEGKQPSDGKITESTGNNTSGIENNPKLTETNARNTGNFPESMENSVENTKSGDSLKNVAQDILSMIAHGNETESTIKKQDLARIKERIRDIFHDKLMLDVESDGKVSDIKQQVDRIYEKLVKTADIIKNNILGQKDNSLGASANELKNNLNFMNELNQLESYVQLPVKFSAEDANGDLYVYNRKRKKGNGDEPLTAFLHLDLMYLGATDIHVSLKNKGVNIVFTLDNAESEELVLEHLDELAERLKEKGYSVAVDANLSEKETEKMNNALLPITEHNDNVVSIKRYTLDIRT